jgi:hypothetical protein
MNTVRRTILFSLLALAYPTSSVFAQEKHAHHHMGMKSEKLGLGTSAAVDAQGRLWIARTEAARDEQIAGQPASAYVVLQMSPDMGKTWTAAKRVQQVPEAIEAEGESRPKLVFGPKGEIYIAYTKPLAKPYTGAIRFVRSTDGGQTFSSPVTVHANRDLITHRFESMIVDRSGRLYIAWIDKRDGEAARARKEKYAGAAVYYAVSEDGGASFKGDYKLADHSCECCRIALALNLDGKPVALWRHVFEPNVRDHALSTLSSDGKPSDLIRASFDDWRIDACPHHGPSLAYAPDGTRHQVWFNVKDDEGGVFYAATNPSGKLKTPVKLGSAQAEHGDVAVQGQNVALVWKQFDGKSTAILGKLSGDGGLTWRDKEFTRTQGNSDHPHLLLTPAGIALVWRTQNEGIRTVLLKSET